MQALRPQSPGSRATTARPGSNSGGSRGRGTLDGLLDADGASGAAQEWEPGSYGLVDAPQPKRCWGRPAVARPASSSLPVLAAAAGSASGGTQSGRAVPMGSRTSGGSSSGGSGSTRILARRAAVPSPFGASGRRSLDSPTGPASPSPAGSGFSPASPTAASAPAEPPHTLGLGSAWLPGQPRVRSQRQAAALLRLDSPLADRDRETLGLVERADSSAFGRLARVCFACVAQAGRLPVLHSALR